MTKLATASETTATMPLIHGMIKKTPVNVDSIEGMTRETDKMVTGTFVNVECPGQPAKICNKFYKKMEYFHKVMEDGERYTIPLSVARFINERCCRDVHGFILDANGNPLKSLKAIARYKFMVEHIAQ